MCCRMLTCLLLLTLVTSGAFAETVSYDGTFSLEAFGSPIAVGVGPSVADVNPGVGGAHLTRAELPGGFATVRSTVTPTSATFTRLIATVADGAGTFTETPSGLLRGALPLKGNVRVCYFVTCGVFVDVPLTENGTRGVGLGGPPIVASGAPFAMVSLQGASWQTGAVTAMSGSSTPSASGFARGPGAATSSTALSGGEVQLVTPIQVTATSVLGSTVIGLFATYNLQLAPEPGKGALLMAGAVAMLLLGRCRRLR